MGVIEEVLEQARGAGSAVRRNMGDMVDDPVEYLTRVLAKIPQTVKEYGEDPMNFLGGGVGAVGRAARAAGVSDFPIANVRRPNGAIGNQGVTASQVEDIMRNVVGATVAPGASMRDMVDMFKGSSELQRALRESMEGNPAVARRLPDGTHHLEDGHHRTFLLNQVGDITVPAIVKD